MTDPLRCMSCSKPCPIACLTLALAIVPGPRCFKCQRLLMSYLQERETEQREQIDAELQAVEDGKDELRSVTAPRKRKATAPTVNSEPV